MFRLKISTENAAFQDDDRGPEIAPTSGSFRPGRSLEVYGAVGEVPQ